MANPAPTRYPTIEQIFNLVRLHLNDAFAGATGTLGEGLVFTDDWTPNLTLLNEAIEQVQIDLELGGVPTLRKEIILYNIPAIDGVNGAGAPDPAAFQRLGFDGFDAGNGTVSPSPALPSDLMTPLVLQQRNSGTMNVFSDFVESAGELPSRIQGDTLGAWEFRADNLGGISIFWNGATLLQDVRLRYQASAAIIASNLNPNQFATTTIPLMDCLQPLAYRIAYVFAQSRLPANAANDLLAQYVTTVNRRIGRAAKAKQYITYERHPYGETGDIFGWE